MRRRARAGVSVAALVVVALAAGACSSPVGVVRVGLERAYRSQYASALASARPSEFSKSVLRRLGMLDRFDDDAGAVLGELHRGLAPTGDEDRLFALAELSFLEGERAGDRARFLAAAVYAYALLFPDERRAPRLPRSDPRVRLSYDLYNQGLARGLAEARDAAPTEADPALEVREVGLSPGTRALPFGHLAIDVDPAGFAWGGYRLERFVSTTALEVRGMRNRYWHPGLGASIAAALAPHAISGGEVTAARIGPRTRVPVTALLRLDAARSQLRSGEITGRLHLYAADQSSPVLIDGQVQPLEFDTTAALAMQLEGNPVYDTEISAFLRGGVLHRLLPVDRAQDGIAFLWPYRRGRVPVVLVHGTASSPARWAELANELLGDARIRDQFQIWLFLYDSGNPIGYSAGRLRAALTAALAEVDPGGSDAALRDMVVIGHSQGGLLTKLTAVESGTAFWDNVSKRPFDSMGLDPDTRTLLRQSMFFTPLPFVSRVIFVATPHRGAHMAAGRLGALAARLVTLPVGSMVRAIGASGDQALREEMRHLPTAIDNMNPQNRFIRTLATLTVAPPVTAHSIIAVRGDGPVANGDDGVVAYASAHIPEAVSEVVVRSDHSVQGHPEAIEEIRRILLEHAAARRARAADAEVCRAAWCAPAQLAAASGVRVATASRQ